MIPIEITEGWSERIPIRMYKNSSPYNITGFTAVVEIHDKDGALVTLQGSDGVITAATGDVYYDPDPGGEFLAVSSPYRVRVKLTSGGRDGYVPNRGGLPMIVRPV